MALQHTAAARVGSVRSQTVYESGSTPVRAGVQLRSIFVELIAGRIAGRGRPPTQGVRAGEVRGRRPARWSRHAGGLVSVPEQKLPPLQTSELVQASLSL